MTTATHPPHLSKLLIEGYPGGWKVEATLLLNPDAEGDADLTIQALYHLRNLPATTYQEWLEWLLDQVRRKAAAPPGAEAPASAAG